MKRAMKGQLPLLGAIKKLMDEVTQPPAVRLRERYGRVAGAGGGGAWRRRRRLRCLPRAWPASGSWRRSKEQQEVMADLADMIAQVYALESALLRSRKLAAAGKSSAEVAAAMTGLLAEETMALAEQATRRVLAACAEGDLLRTQLAILRRLARYTPADTVGLSRAWRGRRFNWRDIRFRD
jgi:alkylation response protein AidB-like acyl-CoA dehydrogenase